MTQSSWYYPQSVAQALKLLCSHKGQTAIIAGATTMALRKDKLPAHVIDLSRCGLDYIRTSEHTLSIGAMTRLADLLPQSLPGVGGAFLAHVAANTATTPLRNMITLGGNLAQCYAWSEMPVVMMAMDATINLKSNTSRRKITAAKFYTGTGKAIKDEEIITQIDIPVYNSDVAAFGYEQIRRTVTDYPLLSVAVFLEQDKGTITNGRIVIGSTKPRPIFCAEASALLTGSSIHDMDGETIAATAAKEAAIVNDPRASIEYKREMIAVLCRRALTKALAGLC